MSEYPPAIDTVRTYSTDDIATVCHVLPELARSAYHQATLRMYQDALAERDEVPTMRISVQGLANLNDEQVRNSIDWHADWCARHPGDKPMRGRYEQLVHELERRDLARKDSDDG